MTLRLVIFDVDGTLVDSFADIGWAMDCAFRACGLPVPDPGAVRGIIGLSLPVAIARLAPTASETQLRALIEAYAASFRSRAEARPETSFFPGALEALDRLHGRDDTLMAVATGKSRRGMERILRTHGIAHLFQSVQTADDHPSKPHPSMIEACLSDTGVDKARAVIVGDTTYDMDMGRAAGIGTVGVGWGYHGSQALVPLAHRIITDFSDLDTALHTIWEGQP